MFKSKRFSRGETCHDHFRKSKTDEDEGLILDGYGGRACCWENGAIGDHRRVPGESNGIFLAVVSDCGEGESVGGRGAEVSEICGSLSVRTPGMRGDRGDTGVLMPVRLHVRESVVAEDELASADRVV